MNKLMNIQLRYIQEMFLSNDSLLAHQATVGPELKCFETETYP